MFICLRYCLTNICKYFVGECKNGTGAVGCGPQEEFRACSDVAITNPDGSADNTPNKLVDPEVYIPKKSADVGQDDEKYNEIDVDSKDSLLQSGIFNVNINKLYFSFKYTEL